MQRLVPLALALALAGCGERAITVEPARGDVRGGEAVRITGQGFAGRGPVAVYFVAAAARGVVVERDTLIRARAPVADGPGEVAVTVHVGDGEVIEVAPRFRYEAAPGVRIEHTPLGPQPVVEGSSLAPRPSG